ncbi:MAG TPA: cytidine deaminase [Rhizomicrobium sp.]|jgi:cytidine deaminase|nr:cytidine deaminase [Rhizomicrobium sp.]
MAHDRMPEGPADMLALARTMMARAYAPYSSFAVGAVLRGANGKLYGGCNVENAAFPESCCAETSAICAMVSDGERRITEILVMAASDDPVTPCGGCRQRLREFADDDVKAHFCSPSGRRGTMTMGELLPHSFGPAHLGVKP